MCFKMLYAFLIIHYMAIYPLIIQYVMNAIYSTIHYVQDAKCIIKKDKSVMHFHNSYYVYNEL